MTDTCSRTKRCFRFTLTNLLVLILGIAIGFTPFKLWELGEPPQPQVRVHALFVDVPRDSLSTLGIDPANAKGTVATRRVSDSFFVRLEKLRQVLFM